MEQVYDFLSLVLLHSFRTQGKLTVRMIQQEPFVSGCKSNSHVRCARGRNIYYFPYQHKYILVAEVC